ncbi:hypothetical protein BSKO_08315 [Bryopsis sp. KO-2023]|nr:hypothetical protein BSKO_08315 [Bryopsis sp. KO-2023]
MGSDFQPSNKNNSHDRSRSRNRTKAPATKRWEKVLYKNQPFDDNYTHSSFLDKLVLNAHVQPRDYRMVVVDSAAVVQQLSTVAMVVSVSVHLHQGTIPVNALLAVCIVVLITGSLLCCLVGGHILGGSVGRGVRQCVLLTGGVYLLSPLLQTLTWTISGDTIVSSSCLSLVLHLYLHDYNFVNSVTDKLTGSVSLGAAVFSSVLIASRLRTNGHVFVQILFALELYLLFPFVRRYVCQASMVVHLALTLAMLAISVLLAAPLSVLLTSMYCAVVGFVSLICPLFLVNLHKFKAKINGPWDEAVPRIPMTLRKT